MRLTKACNGDDCVIWGLKGDGSDPVKLATFNDGKKPEAQPQRD